MEQSTKIFIAVGVLVLIGGGATAYAMSVPKKRGENDLSNPDGTNNANSKFKIQNYPILNSYFFILNSGPAFGAAINRSRSISARMDG